MASTQLQLRRSSPGKRSHRPKTQSHDTPAKEAAGWDVDITCLPELVLVQVFGFLETRDLGRAARVCRAWRQILQSSWPWRHKWVKLNLSLLPRPAWEVLRARNIRHLDVTTRNLFLCLRRVALHFPQVLELKVREYCDLYRGVLKTPVPPAMDNLERLELSTSSESINYYYMDTEDFFSTFFSRLPSLKDLTFRGLFEDDFLLTHRKFLLSMERLHLSSRYIMDRGLEDLVSIEAGWESRLKHLTLSHCSLVSGDGLSRVVQGLPHLQTFEIVSCGSQLLYDLDFLSEEGHDVQSLRVSLSLSWKEASLLITRNGESFSLKLRLPQGDSEASSSAFIWCHMLPTLKHLSFYGLRLSESEMTSLVRELTNLETVGFFCFHPDLPAKLRAFNERLQVVRTGKQTLVGTNERLVSLVRCQLAKRRRIKAI